ALDERRPSFLPTRLNGACEVWFRGVHSDIGGGNGNRGLNDITLKWMMSKAKGAGLPITDADIAALNPMPGTPPATDKPPLEVRDGGAPIAALGRFKARVVLITGDDDLKKAGESVVQLIAAMMNLAQRHGFRELHDVELNEALFNLHPLFPLQNDRFAEPKRS